MPSNVAHISTLDNAVKALMRQQVPPITQEKRVSRMQRIDTSHSQESIRLIKTAYEGNRSKSKIHRSKGKGSTRRGSIVRSAKREESPLRDNSLVDISKHHKTESSCDCSSQGKSYALNKTTRVARLDNSLIKAGPRSEKGLSESRRSMQSEGPKPRSKHSRRRCSMHNTVDRMSSRHSNYSKR